MAFTTELNGPLQPTTIGTDGGASLTAIVNTDFNPVVNGEIFQPVVATTVLADLTGLDVADGSTAIYTFYVRPVISSTNVVTFVYEVDKSKDVPNGTFSPARPFDMSLIVTQTNGPLNVKSFTPFATYLANDLVRFEANIYSAKTGFVAGATFNPDDWNFVSLLTEFNTARAIIGFLMLQNASGAPFIGGTTLLTVGGLTTTYIPYAAFTAQ